MTTREQTADALAAAACTNLKTRARAGKPLPIVDLPIVERLALQGIALGEKSGTFRRVLVDAATGEPIATMSAGEACEFLRHAEGGAA